MSVILPGTPATNSNAIVGGILDILSSMARFRTVSRRLRLWSEVNAGQQPALFVYSPAQTIPERRTGMPSITEVHVDVMIYVRTDQERPTADSEVDSFLQLIIQTLAPSAVTGTCTLGLPVTDIRIEGTITTDHGDTDGQGVLLVPLKVIIP